jgi:hypothetical protein
LSCGARTNPVKNESVAFLEKSIIQGEKTRAVISIRYSHDDSTVNYEGITMRKMTYVHELFRTTLLQILREVWSEM